MSIVVTVVGQRGDGPAMKRTVPLHEFMEAWGPYAPWLMIHARNETVVVGDCRVRIAVGAAA